MYRIAIFNYHVLSNYKEAWLNNVEPDYSVNTDIVEGLVKKHQLLKCCQFWFAAL